ncbi:MAG: hypothetical protein ABJM90_02995 [Paracoccaceae bacterium]
MTRETHPFAFASATGEVSANCLGAFWTNGCLVLQRLKRQVTKFQRCCGIEAHRVITNAGNTHRFRRFGPVYVAVFKR